MSSILDMLNERLGGSNMQEISRQLGTDEQTTSKAVGTALPALLAALSRNATKPDGAEALHKALQSDHDGSVLDDPKRVIDNPSSVNGEGILRHILGNKQQPVEAGIAKASGMSGGSTQKLMGMLAPMVMGALGKQQRQGGLDTNALAGLLGQERQQVEKAAPGGFGMLTKLLDSDGDGDVDLGDLAKQGGGMIGKMFGGR